MLMNDFKHGVKMGLHATKVLFIHQNFPGQFRRIATKLATDPAFDVLAMGRAGCPAMPGVRTLTYTLHRQSHRETHNYVRSYETGVLYGQAVLRVLLDLKNKGYVPDVVVAHSGWGESLFVKEAFPNCKLIHFSEFYYQTSGADLGFDDEFPSSIDARSRSIARNALLLLGLENCDRVISPTKWQKSLHPAQYHTKIEVVHEGIDTDFMRPNDKANFVLPNGLVLEKGDPVVTYVARNLEPYRGFHVWMRAIPELLKRHPTCQIVIAGGDQVSYGSAPKDSSNWRTKMCEEVAFARERVHFVGNIPYERYRSLLQISAAHVYLTYPFVLSWSMLEAMSCGCYVIGSRTEPVKEIIESGWNGQLVDFFDRHALVNKVVDALENPSSTISCREIARQTIKKRYSIEDGLQGYRDLIVGSRSHAKTILKSSDDIVLQF